MAITSGIGLSSGLNFESMISQLMALEKRPINMLQSEKLSVQRKQQAISNVSTKITQFLDASKNFSKPSDFIRRDRKSVV